MPWNTVENLLRFLDCTFQSAVGESVALVEVEIAFIGKEAVSSLGCYVVDVIGGDDDRREVDEVFLACFHLEASLLHHWELGGMADEHIEGFVFLIKSPKIHCVGMEIKGKSQPIPSTNFRLNTGLHCR